MVRLIRLPFFIPAAGQRLGGVRHLVATLALLMSLTDARCQTRSLTPGLTMQGPAEQSSSTTIIRDGLGRACLNIEAAARGHAVDPQMIDHVVSVKNNCPRLIKVKVCYLGADRCNEHDVHAYDRVDTVLGTAHGERFFRYTIFQK